MNQLTEVKTTCCVCGGEKLSCLADAVGDSFSPTCITCYADSIGHGGVPCCFAEATHFVETVCLEAGWNPNADERRAVGEVMKKYYPEPYDYVPCEECHGAEA